VDTLASAPTRGQEKVRGRKPAKATAFRCCIRIGNYSRLFDDRESRIERQWQFEKSSRPPLRKVEQQIAQNERLRAEAAAAKLAAFAAGLVKRKVLPAREGILPEATEDSSE
jgi:hypothetical protein